MKINLFMLNSDYGSFIVEATDLESIIMVSTFLFTYSITYSITFLFIKYCYGDTHKKSYYCIVRGK